jgi:uncharacterized protein (DUF697 family)/predicted GTPase
MLDDVDLGGIIKKALEEAMRERGHANVLIAGRTGVGKSTLINSVFQGQFATTGFGRPVTDSTREIKKEGIPLSIFDTRGLEMAEFSKTLNALKALVVERCKDRDPKQHIHVAWICVAEDLRRVEDAEIALAQMLAEHVPAVGVVTKSRADNGFRAEVQRLMPQLKNVVRVRAVPEKFDDGHSLAPMGLTDLVSLTLDLIPEAQKRAFVAAQKADIAIKKSRSHLIVATSATSAAGLAVAPIPFADAALLLPVQVAMIAGITATFGLSLTQGLLTSLVASTVGGAAATVGGRVLAGNLLKLIPGLGSVAGGALNAAAAAAVTTTFGEAYIAALQFLFVQHGGEAPTTDEIVREVRKRLGTHD